MSFVDPTTIANLESLPVKARVIVEGALSGLHRARHHGSSVEFAEHKDYSPGDEVRHIDWRAYAKLDRYYVKQFEQETQLTAYLLLDASGSMGFRGGGLAKLEYASYLLASLAYLLIKQRDRVGLSVFGDPALDGFVPPRARPRHLHDLLAVIDDVARRGAAGDEPAGKALERIGELSRRRRSLIVMASDLFDPEDSALVILRRLKAQGHDVALFHVLDPHEIEFPYEGLTVFESLEDERRMLVNPAAVRREYKQKMARFLERARTECVDGGVEYHQVSTDAPLDRTLLDFLNQRARATAKRPRAWSS
jgi:uncharacterized protein (DUF58 family)